MHTQFSSTGAVVTLVGVVALGGVLGLIACREDLEAPISELRGQWGGAHFGLLVTGTEATAVFDCGAGELEIPISVDDEGYFGAPGDYTREIGPAALTNAALYEGRVTGDRLVLAATVTDTLGGGDPFRIGPFVGTLDRDPEVAHCQ